VKGPIIEQQQVEAGGISGGELIEEELKALRIEERQFEKEALPGPRFHRPVQVETLEAVGRGQERLHAASGDAAAHDRQEPTAAFILSPDPPLPIAALLCRVDRGQELRAERVLELGNFSGLFFGWERRGALGLAPSL
jgi:hypothetical protein